MSRYSPRLCSISCPSPRYLPSSPSNLRGCQSSNGSQSACPANSILEKWFKKYFSIFVCPDLAELVRFTGHLLKGLVVVLGPAVQVDALPALAAVAVLRAVFHVTKKCQFIKYYSFSEWLLLKWIVWITLYQVFEIESKQIWLASRDVTQINRNVRGFGGFILFILHPLYQGYFMQFWFRSIKIIEEVNK